MKAPRTITLGEGLTTTIVLEHVRAWRIDPAYNGAESYEDGHITTVWLDLYPHHPICIKGHHHEALLAAYEARP